MIDFIEEFNLPILHSGIEYLPPAIDIQVREQEIQILYRENNQRTQRPQQARIRITVLISTLKKNTQDQPHKYILYGGI